MPCFFRLNYSSRWLASTSPRLLSFYRSKLWCNPSLRIVPIVQADVSSCGAPGWVWNRLSLIMRSARGRHVQLYSSLQLLLPDQMRKPPTVLLNYCTRCESSLPVILVGLLELLERNIASVQRTALKVHRLGVSVDTVQKMTQANTLQTAAIVAASLVGTALVAWPLLIW